MILEVFSSLNDSMIQGEFGWGFEQPGLVGDVPAHGRGAGTK